jgi:hypothetical protein
MNWLASVLNKKNDLKKGANVYNIAFVYEIEARKTVFMTTGVAFLGSYNLFLN